MTVMDNEQTFHIIFTRFAPCVISCQLLEYFYFCTAYTRRWSKPIYIGEYLIGYVTVKKILARKKLVVCELMAKNQDGEVCITGKVTLLIRNLDVDDKAKDKKKLK